MKKTIKHWNALGLILAGLLMVSAWAAESQNSPLPAKASLPVVSGPAGPEKRLPIHAPVDLLPGINLSGGKSMLLPLPEPAARISIGNPDVADVTLINAQEVYVLGKKTGITNLIVWSANGKTTLRDVSVGLDTGMLQSRLAQWVPTNEPLMVDVMADTLVLRSQMDMASVVTSGSRKVDLLQKTAPQPALFKALSTEPKPADGPRSVTSGLTKPASLNQPSKTNAKMEVIRGMTRSLESTY